MKKSIYITNNSEDTLNTLKELGYHICACCNFFNVKWLHYYLRDNGSKEFHGIGNSCESECVGNNSAKCIECSIKEALRNNYEIHIFNDVISCYKYLNENT